MAGGGANDRMPKNDGGRLTPLTLCADGKDCDWMPHHEDESWRRCMVVGCDCYRLWMHKKCWIRNHRGGSTKDHRFEESTQSTETLLDANGFIKKAAGDQAQVACTVLRGAVQSGGAMAFMLCLDDVAKILPSVFNSTGGAELTKTLVSNGALQANAAAAGVVATVEILTCYRDWCNHVMTKKEFQVAVGLQLLLHSNHRHRLPRHPQTRVALAGACGLTVLACALATGVAGAASGRLLCSQATKKLQEQYYRSDRDEEKEFIMIIQAAQHLGILAAGHSAWGFTDEHVETCYRRQAISLHPDTNPLHRDAGETQEDYKGRLDVQKTNFDKLRVDCIALKAFIAQRTVNPEKWAPFKVQCTRWWNEMATQF